MASGLIPGLYPILTAVYLRIYLFYRFFIIPKTVGRGLSFQPGKFFFFCIQVKDASADRKASRKGI